jgi:glycerate kinase
MHPLDPEKVATIDQRVAHFDAVLDNFINHYRIKASELGTAGATAVMCLEFNNTRAKDLEKMLNLLVVAIARLADQAPPLPPISTPPGA